MEDELKVLWVNNTWSLLRLLLDANIVTCQWVFKVKWDEDGTFAWWKAWLFSRGFNQYEWVDFHETFGPMIKFTIVWLILSIAVTKDWCLQQLDINNAFLHNDLQEKVYMSQPPRYKDQVRTNHVCFLHWSIDGLRQSSHVWYEKLRPFLTLYGFIGSRVDSSLFYIPTRTHDLVLARLCQRHNHNWLLCLKVERLIATISRHFAVKNLGSIRFFLGDAVSRSSTHLWLSQKQYIVDLL